MEPKIIKQALNGCNVYVAMTYEETEGITIIEAAGCKTDMVVRDIPVFEDWLIDSENVYKAKDIDQFECKIRKIVNNELPSLKDEAYKIAEERKSNIIGEKLGQVYTKVLKEKV